MIGYFIYFENGKADCLGEVKNADERDSILAEMRALLGAKGGGRSKKVIATNVNNATAAKYPVFENQEFPNALQASEVLGFKGNAVAQALNKAKREGHLSAEVRGVTWWYAEDFASD